MEIPEPKKKFQALGALGPGTVKVKFKTTIEWTELKPPETALDGSSRHRVDHPTAQRSSAHRR